jgi:hypothetical protein
MGYGGPHCRNAQMTSEKYDWVGFFTTIEALMTSAPNQRSAEFAASEAERHGLTKQGEADGTYQDKIWERTADGVILRLKWRCYDQSHTYRALPDMNVLSLELRQGDKILRQAESRFED